VRTFADLASDDGDATPKSGGLLQDFRSWIPEEPSAGALTDSCQGRGATTSWLARLLPAETVEFSVSYASDKCMPFVRSELEDLLLGVPAVANADSAAGQGRHLDAVAVGETQRALDPAGTRIRPFRLASEHSSSHVIPH